MSMVKKIHNLEVENIDQLPNLAKEMLFEWAGIERRDPRSDVQKFMENLVDGVNVNRNYDLVQKAGKGIMKTLCLKS